MIPHKIQKKIKLGRKLGGGRAKRRGCVFLVKCCT